MDEILYLESDEEITSVVDKLKGLETGSIGLVVPKGSTIAQSMVSLKLLKKEAKSQDKKIAIITSDEVGRNLAAQVGLPVYADVKSHEPLNITLPEEISKEPIEISMEDEVPAAEAITPLAESSKAGEATQEETAESIPEEELPQNFKMHRYDDAKDEEPVEEPKTLEPIAAPVASPANEESPAHLEEVESEHNIELSHHDLNKPAEVAAKAVELKPESPREPFHAREIEPAKPIKDLPKINNPSKLKKKTAIIFAATAIGLILLLALADLSVAKLTVAATIPADKIEKEVPIIIEKDRPTADLANATIPGIQTSKEQEITKTINSTGSKDAGTQAKGTLTFRNDAGVDDTIALGTTITSSSGVGFTLDATVAVPKASLNSNGDKVLGQATGTVTAKNSGTSGNLAASTTYIVSGKSKISAIGATSGGVTKQVKIVSKSDLENAQNTLKTEGGKTIMDEISQDKTMVFLTDANVTELNNFSADKNAADEADTFVAKAMIKVMTLGYKSDDFKQAVIQAVSATLPSGQGLLTSDADTIATQLKDNNINTGKITILGKLDSHVGPKIDIAGMTKSWRLKRLKTIRQSIENIPGATVGDISITPSIALPLAPILSSHMTLNLEYTKK